MTTGDLQEKFRFLKLEDIIEKARRGEKLSQRELGNLLSRTFGPNIDLLMFAGGKNESEDTFKYVTNLNNNARFVDCIEDGELDKNIKLDAFRRLGHLYNRVDLTEVDIENLIDTDLKKLISDVKVGALNDEERWYIEQFGFGDTFRDLRRFKPSIRNVIIKDCMNPMINGMVFRIPKGRLETVGDLKDYCYSVAGTVGEALNRIVNIEQNAHLSFFNARCLGAYVQLTNILKNIREDFDLSAYRVKFIPDELHAGIEYKDLFKDKIDFRIVREKVLEGMLAVAKDYFDPAAQYVIDIPRQFPGYLAFCTTAFLLCTENQKLTKDSGAEKVFISGGEDALKVGRSCVRNVIKFVSHGVNVDDCIKLISFLNDYRKNPDQFPFRPDEAYEKWSRDYFK